MAPYVAPLEGLADPEFAVAVADAGVYEVDAEVQGPVDDLYGFIDGWALDGDASDADATDLEAGPSEGDLLHG